MGREREANAARAAAAAGRVGPAIDRNGRPEGCMTPPLTPVADRLRAHALAPAAQTACVPVQKDNVNRLRN